MKTLTIETYFCFCKVAEKEILYIVVEDTVSVTVLRQGSE